MKQNENKERPRKKFWQRCLQRQNCRTPSGRRKTGMHGWNQKWNNRSMRRFGSIWQNPVIPLCICPQRKQKPGTGCRNPNNSDCCRKNPNRYSKSGRQENGKLSQELKGVRMICGKIWFFCSLAGFVWESKEREWQDRRGFGNQDVCHGCRRNPRGMSVLFQRECRGNPEMRKQAGQEA